MPGHICTVPCCGVFMFVNVISVESIARVSLQQEPPGYFFVALFDSGLKLQNQPMFLCESSVLSGAGYNVYKRMYSNNFHLLVLSPNFTANLWLLSSSTRLNVKLVFAVSIVTFKVITI